MEQPHHEDIIYVEDESLRLGFTQIPNAVLRRPTLSAGAKLTYMGLLSYAWQEGSCFPGQDRLAVDLGVSRRSVIIYLQQLQEVGLLRIRRRGLGKTNIYTLTRITPVGESSGRGRSAESAHQEVKNPTHQQVQILHTKKTQEEKDPDQEDTAKASKVARARIVHPSPRSGQDHTADNSAGGSRPGLTSLAGILAARKAIDRPSALQGPGRAPSERSSRGDAPATGERDFAHPEGGIGDVGSRPRSRPGRLPLAELIRLAVPEFSNELHDEHPGSSLTRAIRLWQHSGLPEDVFVQQVLYPARSAARQLRRVTKRSAHGGVNRMPLFFAECERLLGLRDPADWRRKRRSAAEATDSRARARAPRDEVPEAPTQDAPSEHAP